MDDYSININSNFAEYIDSLNPCMIVNLDNFEIVEINEAMSVRVDNSQKKHGKIGSFQTKQILQNWLAKSTTIHDTQEPKLLSKYAYETLTPLNEINNHIEYSYSKDIPFILIFENNFPVVDDDFYQEYQLHESLINSRILECAIGENVYVKISLIQKNSQNYAKIEYEIKLLFMPSFLQEVHRPILSRSHFDVLEQSHTPCLLADPESGIVFATNQRLHTQFIKYEQALIDNPKMPKFHLIGTGLEGYIFYEQIRETYTTQYLNPLIGWDQKSEIVYHIYDLGLNKAGEKYRSNIFNQSIQVRINPVTIEGETFALCSYTPTATVAPPKQKFTYQQGVMLWKELLFNSVEETDIGAFMTLNVKSSLDLLKEYYQADDALFLAFNNEESNCDFFFSNQPIIDEFNIQKSNLAGLKNCCYQLEKKAYSFDNDLDTSKFFKTGTQFIDLLNRDTLLEILTDIEGKSNSIRSSSIGKTAQVGQSFIGNRQVRSLGLGVCYNLRAKSVGIVVVFNPLCHLEEDFGQLGLLHSVTHALTVQINFEYPSLDFEVRDEIPKYWQHLTHDVTAKHNRLIHEYGVGDGQTRKEPIDALIPYWQSRKPKEMGVILTSLADNWQIPFDLQTRSMRVRKKDADLYDESDSAFEIIKIQLPVRRYTGSPSVLACFGWKKSEFDRLVKEVEASSPDGEIVGSAWGNGYYWIEKLLDDAKLLQFIKQQKNFANQNWEITDNQHLSKLLYDLEENMYHVELQPQVMLQPQAGKPDWECYGAEALIRRTDRSSFPDEFVPIFEEQGIVRHIDFFVLDTVCKNIKLWNEKYNKQIRISVNLSRVTLMEADIVTSVVEVCDRYSIPHELIMIEVTNRIGTVKSDVSKELIQQFRESGFKVALDDFGADTSNLDILSNISVDEVKVDKKLVEYLSNTHITCSNDDNVRGMVRNVITMCQEFEYETITLAEGIENLEQAETLREYKCLLGQGYFFSKPISIQKFHEKYIKNI